MRVESNEIHTCDRCGGVHEDGEPCDGPAAGMQRRFSRTMTRSENHNYMEFITLPSEPIEIPRNGMPIGVPPSFWRNWWKQFVAFDMIIAIVGWFRSFFIRRARLRHELAELKTRRDALREECARLESYRDNPAAAIARAEELERLTDEGRKTLIGYGWAACDECGTGEAPNFKCVRCGAEHPVVKLKPR